MTDVRYTPSMSIQNLANQCGIRVEEIGVAPLVVVSWSRKLIDSFAAQIGAEIAPHWLYPDRFPLFSGKVAGRAVSLVFMPIGASGTIMVMEELIACGAQNFIGLGWAGSLQPQAPIGALLLPNACLREEGTSFHYFPNEVNLTPDHRLAGVLQQTAEEQGMPVLQGLQWTTDAPYRETVDKIEAYRQQGVLGVDMETSAMFALGLYRGVGVANLLVVSDELWQPLNSAFRTPELIAATEQARQIVERSLRRLNQIER